MYQNKTINTNGGIEHRQNAFYNEIITEPDKFNFVETGGR